MLLESKFTLQFVKEREQLAQRYRQAAAPEFWWIWPLDGCLSTSSAAFVTPAITDRTSYLCPGENRHSDQPARDLGFEDWEEPHCAGERVNDLH